jgi:hypothetical protein
MVGEDFFARLGYHLLMGNVFWQAAGHEAITSVDYERRSIGNLDEIMLGYRRN